MFKGSKRYMDNEDKKKKRKNFRIDVASFSNEVFSIRKYKKVGITNDWRTEMCATNQVKGDKTARDKHENPIDPIRNACSEPLANQTHTDYLCEHLIEVKHSAGPAKRDFR
ncbi:hypothetical protein QTP88_028282 [Uroleucon formosanum]